MNNLMVYSIKLIIQMFRLDGLTEETTTNEVYSTKRSLEKKRKGLAVAVNMTN